MTLCFRCDWDGIDQRFGIGITFLGNMCARIKHRPHHLNEQKMSLVSNNLYCHSTTHFECCSMRVSTVCILWRSIYAFALLLEMLFFLPLMALIVAFSVCIFFVPWIEWKMMFAIFPNLAFVKYGCIIKAKIVTKLKKNWTPNSRKNEFIEIECNHLVHDILFMNYSAILLEFGVNFRRMHTKIDT